MSPISFDAPISGYYPKDVDRSQIVVVDKWAKYRLGFVCKRWFNIVHQNIFTMSHYHQKYNFNVTSGDSFKYLTKTLKRDMETPMINQSTKTIEIDKKKMRVYGLTVQYGLNDFSSLTQEVQELFELLSQYPHLREIRFNGDGTRPFLYLFLRIAGEIYLNDRTRFPSFHTISICNIKQDEDNILYEMSKYEFLGAEKLTMHNSHPPQKHSINPPRKPVHSSGMKSITNRYFEFVDWTILSFSNLTRFKILCSISLIQFISILSTLNQLQSLTVQFDESYGAVESFRKWYKNIYLQENPDLVSLLSNYLNQINLLNH
ncbi:hypothetical protein DLAC_02866 [Tieghemostelium lacteum]|uniref:Uncharacterized protein n=1 Tax=Tieghemostelium lacteum TaxID=361077 RepID=A0A152A3N1_TIELA|nr:hypothetical protein DLAC_02866 [Tieghemostelium lacteum]|eukprot:KYR00814.1 hypothetical protein DLAC_02866 [Tieghemostelium lacteum]